MKIKALKKVVSAVAIVAGSFCATGAWAAHEPYEVTQKGFDYTNTVSGVWFTSERLEFEKTGQYELSLTDFNFGGALESFGVMISTGSEKVAQLIFSAGEAPLTPIQFNVEEENYWISMFAITPEGRGNLGAFGVSIDSMLSGNPSEVPAPPALVLMLTGLMGLGAYARKAKKTKKIGQ